MAYERIRGTKEGYYFPKGEYKIAYNARETVYFVSKIRESFRCLGTMESPNTSPIRRKDANGERQTLEDRADYI